jgi:hypothetical protein
MKQTFTAHDRWHSFLDCLVNSIDEQIQLLECYAVNLFFLEQMTVKAALK